MSSLLEIEQSIDKLESNLISEINELRATTELVLKELTVYLNFSANDIEKIKESNEELYRVVTKITDTITILDSINKKINSIPEEFRKINETFMIAREENAIENKKYYSTNLSSLKTIYNYMKVENEGIKKSLSHQLTRTSKIEENVADIVSALKDYKEEINRGQENLINVINALIKSSGEKIKSEHDVKKTEIDAGSKKIELRSTLWVKIVGGVFGGGALATLIQIIINSLQKGA